MARKRKDDGGTTVLESNGVPQQQQQGRQPEEPDGPCKTFTCEVGGGAVMEAAIWRKEVKGHEKTVTVYTVAVRKNYRAGEEWQQTPLFRGSEIHLAQHVLQLAERWILNQRTEENPPI